MDDDILSIFELSALMKNIEDDFQTYCFLTVAHDFDKAWALGAKRGLFIDRYFANQTLLLLSLRNALCCDFPLSIHLSADLCDIIVDYAPEHDLRYLVSEYV